MAKSNVGKKPISKEEYTTNKVLAVFSVCLLGVLVLINPFGAFAALVVLIVLSLVFDGASDLYLIWRLSRAFRDLDQGEGGWFE